MYLADHFFRVVGGGFHIIVGYWFYVGVELFLRRYCLSPIISKATLEISGPFVIFAAAVMPSVGGS